MSNGQHRAPDDSHAVMRTNIVSPSAYEANRQNIAKIQKALENAAVANDVGYQRYLARHRELLERIRAGQEAEEQLARLADPQRGLIHPPAALPVNSGTDQPTMSHYTGPPGSRIEEVSSPTESSRYASAWENRRRQSSRGRFSNQWPESRMSSHATGIVSIQAHGTPTYMSQSQEHGWVSGSLYPNQPQTVFYNGNWYPSASGSGSMPVPQQTDMNRPDYGFVSPPPPTTASYSSLSGALDGSHSLGAQQLPHRGRNAALDALENQDKGRFEPVADVVDRPMPPPSQEDSSGPSSSGRILPLARSAPSEDGSVLPIANTAREATVSAKPQPSVATGPLDASVRSWIPSLTETQPSTVRGNLPTGPESALPSQKSAPPLDEDTQRRSVARLVADAANAEKSSRRYSSSIQTENAAAGSGALAHPSDPRHLASRPAPSKSNTDPPQAPPSRASDPLFGRYYRKTSDATAARLIPPKDAADASKAATQRWMQTSPRDSWLLLAPSAGLLYKSPTGQLHHIPHGQDISPYGPPKPSTTYFELRRLIDGRVDAVLIPPSVASAFLRSVTPPSRASQAQATHQGQTRPGPAGRQLPPFRLKLPGHTNVKTLAKDVLYALGYPPIADQPNERTVTPQAVADQSQPSTLQRSQESNALPTQPSVDSRQPPLLASSSSIENAEPSTSATTVSENIHPEPLPPSSPPPPLPAAHQDQVDQDAMVTSPPVLSKELPSSCSVQSSSEKDGDLVDIHVDGEVHLSTASTSEALPATQPQNQSIPDASSTAVVPMTPEPEDSVQDETSMQIIPPGEHIDLPATKVPLFFPSPVSSVHGLPTTPQNEIVDEGPQRVRSDLASYPTHQPRTSPLPTSDRRRARKVKEVYVLVPPAPYRTPGRSYKKRSSMASGGGQSQGSIRQMLTVKKASAPFMEQTPVDLDITRVMSVRNCKWTGCDARLNSGDTLERHVFQHLEEAESLACQWNACPLEFSEKERLRTHLIRHMHRRLVCPYNRCDNTYDMPESLLRHVRLHHSQNDTLKPVSTPFRPRFPVSMPPVPNQVPAWTHEARRVEPAPISQERHAHLGPWVSRNICGDIDLGLTMQYAGVPLKADDHVEVHNHDEYAFLALFSRGYKDPAAETRRAELIRKFKDLPSSEISELVHSGIIFLEKEDEMESVEPLAEEMDQGPTEVLDQMPQFEDKLSMEVEDLLHSGAKLPQPEDVLKGAVPSADETGMHALADDMPPRSNSMEFDELLDDTPATSESRTPLARADDPLKPVNQDGWTLLMTPASASDEEENVHSMLTV